MPVSSLPLPKTVETISARAAKRQACTSWLLLDHIPRYGCEVLTAFGPQ